MRNRILAAVLLAASSLIAPATAQVSIHTPGLSLHAGPPGHGPPVVVAPPPAVVYAPPTYYGPPNKHYWKHWDKHHKHQHHHGHWD